MRGVKKSVRNIRIKIGFGILNLISIRGAIFSEKYGKKW